MTVPAVTVVCLLLMALLAFAQVAHLHANTSDADHCPLCVVMHSAVPAAQAPAAVVLVQMESATQVFRPRSIVRYWYPRHVTRPPPEAC